MQNFKKYFGNALWITAGEDQRQGADEYREGQPPCPVLRQSFTVRGKVQNACLHILGLGTFRAYLNGQPIGQDLFLPLNSDYEHRIAAPTNELTDTRIYVCRFDNPELEPLFVEGENILTVFLGNGWYSFPTNFRQSYGCLKAVWNLRFDDADGHREIISDPHVRVKDSFAVYSELVRGERHDYRNWREEELLAGADLSDWGYAMLCPPVDTRYMLSDCPADRVIASRTPTVVSVTEEGTLYDAGENLTGYPVLRLQPGAHVKIWLTEDLEDGKLDPKYKDRQVFVCDNGEIVRDVNPLYTWFGFRYFLVEGDAEVLRVDRIHAHVDVSSSFESSDETLNWIYRAFVNSMLTNMHRGTPSDCPHFERRGYTGDGELTCGAALQTFDAKAFYDKWLADIADCQDRISGHVQYTAPYVRSGGGPGGWGIAIIKVPYLMYKQYGDLKYLTDFYPAMCHYLDYLDAHSENGLVTSDKPGEWCLGDWCIPDRVILPQAFVNSFFHAKALELMAEIAGLTGHDADIPRFLQKFEQVRQAIRGAYYNTFNNNFFSDRQGASAFGLDLGICHSRERRSFIEYYDRMGYYDTGIVGTPLVTHLLFALGEGPVALKLLTNKEPNKGYDYWRQVGATTLWEYFGGLRSHNHPMFGSVVEDLLTRVLGLRQDKGSAGWTSALIAPEDLPALSRARGHVTTPHGLLGVNWERRGNLFRIETEVPQNLPTTLLWQGKRYPLPAGKSVRDLPIAPIPDLDEREAERDMEIVLLRARDAIWEGAATGLGGIPATETQLPDTCPGDLPDTLMFPDLDYADQTRSAWKAVAHLRRIDIAIKAAGRARINADSDLRKKLICLLRFWALHDFTNPNWWHNEIGTPRLLCQISLLLEPWIREDSELLSALEKILSRGTLAGNPKGGRRLDSFPEKPEQFFDGANATWLALNSIMTGLLTRDASLVFDAMKIVERETDGGGHNNIRSDAAFWQHGPRWCSGSYGASFTCDVSLIISLMHGTVFALSYGRTEGFLSHVLEGQRLCQKNGYWDPNCVARDVSRVGGLDAKVLAKPVSRLSKLFDFQRSDELSDFLAELEGHPVRPTEKTRWFGSVSALVHHGSDRYIGVKNHNHTQFDQDSCNGEALLCYNMTYGSRLCFMHRGNEYENINPIFNWAYVPGTTARDESAAELLAHKDWCCTPLPNTHTCGTALGNVGVTSELAEHDGISVQTAFFTFGGRLVALGCSVTDFKGSITALHTVLDQCNVYDAKIDPAGLWASCGGFTYFSLNSDHRLIASVESRVGSWKDNNTDITVDRASGDVFTAYLPVRASGDYAFAVIPRVENTQPTQKDLSEALGASVLRNDADCQAILLADGSVLAAFHRDCDLILGDRVIRGSADHCLILPGDGEAD